MNALNLPKLFHGYQETSQLWKGNSVYGIEQLPMNLNTTKVFVVKKEPKKLRLGKWVEHFVSFQLKQKNTIQVLGESIQIKDGKQTIGELDHIFTVRNQPIHLEVVYKFYLYDPDIVENDSLANWIGPNRNDSLIYKLDKLKSKQLKLLHHPKTAPLLDEYKIDINEVLQFVHFKAKLFIPFGQKLDSTLNKDCLAGYYIRFEELHQFVSCKFYIPRKLEWLITPNLEADWISFDSAKSQILKNLSEKRSPLIWAKSKSGEITQLFIVWW